MSQDTKVLADKAKEMANLSWDDVFDPVAANKKKVIEKQQQLVNPKKRSDSQTSSTLHIVTESRTNTAGRLKKLPILLKDLKSDKPNLQQTALIELSSLTEITNPVEDEVIGKTGIIKSIVACLSNPALQPNALSTLLHLTLLDLNRRAVAENPETIPFLVHLAADGNVLAESVLNNCAPLAEIRTMILNTPGGKGAEVLAKMARERRPLYKKGTQHS